MGRDAHTAHIMGAGMPIQLLGGSKPQRSQIKADIGKRRHADRILILEKSDHYPMALVQGEGLQGPGQGFCIHLLTVDPHHNKSFGPR